MKANHDWVDVESSDCSYFFDNMNGRIFGQVHKISHTKIWMAKAIHANNEEHFLGQFISQNFAKNAVMEYWNIQEMTFLEN